MILVRCSVALLLLLSLMIVQPAIGQIPDTFTNLQLLPEDIDKGRLVGTMKNWAGGLGVRCTHCHVGSDNLVGMDFASDEKPTKRTARRMLEMSRAINRDLLRELPVVEEGERHQIVSCYTCHHGQSTPPRNISVQLGTVAGAEGTAAALENYRDLRAEHYGAGLYDFREQTLVRLARDLTRGGRTDDALTVLELNQEYFADSADTIAAMGDAHLQAGDEEAASKSYRRALEFDPENQMAKWRLEQMEQTEADDD
ncbi:MAG: c-type cytochrome [Thermoanaerobaculia bacterium]